MQKRRVVEARVPRDGQYRGWAHGGGPMQRSGERWRLGF